MSLILAVHWRCSFWEVCMAFSPVGALLAFMVPISHYQHLAAQFGFSV